MGGPKYLLRRNLGSIGIKEELVFEGQPLYLKKQVGIFVSVSVLMLVTNTGNLRKVQVIMTKDNLTLPFWTMISKFELSLWIQVPPEKILGTPQMVP